MTSHTSCIEYLIPTHNSSASFMLTFYENIWFLWRVLMRFIDNGG